MSPAAQYDVAIVGGRCAGAPLAVHLARLGLRVCVLDRAHFPSDTPSTHIIQPRGTAALERLGARAALDAAGAAPLRRYTLLYDGVTLDADLCDPRADRHLSTGNTPGLCVRRTVLDEVLLRAAADAGADVRTRTAATALLRDGERVSGVRTAAGDVRARVVVGADGRKSFVAREVDAREYAVYPAPRMAAWAYFEGAADDGGRLRIGRIGTSALLACPTDGGLQLAGVVPAISQRTAFLADRDKAFATELRRWPALAGVLDGAERVGPMRVVPDWRGYLRSATGPGWVLTGDAGNFKDPSAAQGITDALRQAETLSSALVRGLDADGDPDHELRQWGRWRDKDCRDMHWFAAGMAAAGPAGPVMREMIRDVAERDGGLPFAALLNRDLRSTDLLTARRAGSAVLRAVSSGPAAIRPVTRDVVRLAREQARAVLPQR
ncbi:NAD(P)/FAD-dependent oxidoreductase [uncultured Jatrophihabitans sp.]|uniref:NAD(P)/FAD-dependent oxidoreductase n=1 Tax=uncultured Jatrophihabitans sp. TaxID=1610747 RepID=UPI0035C9A1BC